MVAKLEQKVRGYEAFRKAVSKLYADDKVQQLNIYFTGEKNDAGISWCPDCNNAEPHVMKALQEYADKDSVFLVVDVGNRSFWKDMKNPFRTDADTRLTVIPTLLRWKSVVRLNGDHCAKPPLVEMFFVEDSD